MGFFNFKSRDSEEKRRLEAFMDALPYEYCGWNDHGVAVWSRNFPKLFGLNSIHNVRDIQQALLPSDAAALEGMIFSLKKDAEAFTLNVQTHQDNRIITIYGMTGKDLDEFESYDVLWAQDTTLKNHTEKDAAEKIEKLVADVSYFQSILDNLPQSVWVSDDEQNITWCNKNYIDFSEKPQSELINNPEIFNPILIEPHKISVANMAKKSLETNEPDTSTGRIIINGKRRLMDIHVVPFIQNKFVVHSAYDITEQEELRAQLKRYVSANSELMEQLSTAIAIFGADHKLEFFNQAFSTLWGLEDRWLNTHPVLGDILEKLRELRRLPEQANFKDYKKSWLDMFTSLIDQHQSMMYLPSGMALRYMVVPHPMGGLMMTFEDVTSRLELESSYNTLIAVQNKTLDNLAEGVAVFGTDARLQLYNPSYLKLWGLNPEDVESKPHINELLTKKRIFFKDHQDLWADIEVRLRAHAIDRTDIRERIIRSNGTILECSSVALPDGGVMVTYRDVSDNAKVQQALEEKNQALQDAEKLKTDFLANVSYQLRTPLNAISGFAEILNHEYFGTLNDKQREYTQGIHDATERLTSLINDILDLSSIEAGYLRLDKNPVDILDLMGEIYDLTRDWAGMETLKTKFNRPKKSLGLLMLDEKRMKQAMMNIIRNAISYTPGGGNVTLSLIDNPESVQVIIKDSGVGIGEDDQDKMFKPFGSIPKSEDIGKQQNTGLGLTLARNIIAMHGGDIVVQSILGEGTTVTVTLPK